MFWRPWRDSDCDTCVFMCGVEIVMGLSIFELQCDASGLKPSVGLIGHVKDIVNRTDRRSGE